MQSGNRVPPFRYFPAGICMALKAASPHSKFTGTGKKKGGPEERAS
jgi:hypothetical protein